MDQEESGDQSKEQPKEESPVRPAQLASCDCAADPYAALPPELRPKRRSWKAGFRKVTCLDCGTTFWTNAEKVCCPKCGAHILQESVDA
jgi:hypothetical protein